jgi:hypothetical protein
MESFARRAIVLTAGLAVSVTSAALTTPTAGAVPSRPSQMVRSAAKQKPIPRVVTGTFTGQWPGVNRGGSGPAMTWNGTATFAVVKRSGNRYLYKLTAFSMQWTALRRQNWAGDSCTASGGGTVTLPEASAAPGDYYAYVLTPGAYGFDINIKAPFDYTYTCTSGETGTDHYVWGGQALVTSKADPTYVAVPPVSPNGKKFTGHFEESAQSIGRDYTWSFVGKNLFKGPKLY